VSEDQTAECRTEHWRALRSRCSKTRGGISASSRCVVPHVSRVGHELLLSQQQLNMGEDHSRLTASKNIGRYDGGCVLAQWGDHTNVDLSMVGTNTTVIAALAVDVNPKGVPAIGADWSRPLPCLLVEPAAIAHLSMVADGRLPECPTGTRE
jgi:hypothetical protein